MVPGRVPISPRHDDLELRNIGVSLDDDTNVSAALPFD